MFRFISIRSKIKFLLILQPLIFDAAKRKERKDNVRRQQFEQRKIDSRTSDCNFVSNICCHFDLHHCNSKCCKRFTRLIYWRRKSKDVRGKLIVW